MLATPTMTPQEFAHFQRFVAQMAGIHLSAAKIPLVAGRLSARLRHYRFASYGAYFRLLSSGKAPEEVQVAVDLLTTHETSFFREMPHFTFLRDTVLPAHQAGQPFRVWSAACSSGEEPYSIAMLLADCLGERPWELLASDISTGSLAKAQAGHYPMERAARIPQEYLAAYCLKGVGRQTGTFLIADVLRRRLRFAVINLNASLPQIEPVDVIFVRNVMIYFDAPTKTQVVQRLRTVLRPAGYLFIGHSESLHGLTTTFKLVCPGVYRLQ
ncbi:MAG: protein-glutamate O-methyltransferase CheR [Candidatus Tectomicrobia bacterium]|uniref:protein-glutamate O-methyltransferase n=1 Tax=Tectimicrobiota bacterium TaxID=2528274 RepID=A0A937W0G7_UNCTE|nr:protein-glutamate O-methyltransferase CheR [Candidatus Tectomicrobia bacterium]